MSAPAPDHGAAQDHGAAPDGTPAPVHHVFDDIEEHDNHLPNWWLGILYGTIVFSFGYWFVYETTRAAPSPLEEYRAEMEALAKKRAEAGPVTNDALAVLARDERTLEEGKKLFQQTCAPCHGAEGQGLAGPNLTDVYWLHGAAPIEIHASITKGFPDKGMPAWAPVLGDARVRSLAAFVLTMKGKNLPGKPPQGNPVE